MSAAELKALLDAGSRPPIALVDLRPDAAFRQGHLPGARSVPITQLRRRARDIAPGRVVLYCDCPAEEVEAAHAFLLNLGWDDVRALAEGFAGWVGRGYPVAR
jgi:rhodanese-related sulfurtransferase